MYPAPLTGHVPMTFAVFDARYMQEALDVFCDETAAGQYGGGAIYNTNFSDPPTAAHWNPRFAMTSNAGNHTVTSPSMWAQIQGPRRAVIFTYYGGQVPD